MQVYVPAAGHAKESGQKHVADPLGGHRSGAPEHGRRHPARGAESPRETFRPRNEWIQAAEWPPTSHMGRYRRSVRQLVMCAPDNLFLCDPSSRASRRRRGTADMEYETLTKAGPRRIARASCAPLSHDYPHSPRVRSVSTVNDMTAVGSGVQMTADLVRVSIRQAKDRLAGLFIC